ncbi:uncharacterized protein LY89DRAFT_597549, partial [Mollisia scopiformis]
PQIFLLSLAYWEPYDEIYTSLIDQLSNHAEIKRAKSANSAITFLENENPRAVIVTDQDLHDNKNKHVFDKVVSWARGGGTVIVGLSFCGFTIPTEFKNFFSSFGLPWTRGDYHRTNFQFNPSLTLPPVMQSSLSAPYSMKVLHVDKARPEEKLYIPVDGARIQSSVFAADPVNDPTQAAVAGAKIGQGDLLYIGGVNGEEGSHEITMRFCGL